MTRLEIKALMAAMIAAGRRAAETPDYYNADREKFARQAALDAEEVLRVVEERSTADDNEPVVYVPPAQPEKWTAEQQAAALRAGQPPMEFNSTRGQQSGGRP